ncbi:hypothetical protein GY45DRAFT_1325117 [Cubamyces sp. BRFM 1775]|nr:hypothetical protein GY45DRAFT_1325117 [Cubamyces sp. BRFM 1775]
MFSRLAFVFAAISTVVSGNIVPKATCSRFFEVSPGDTCDGISAQTSTPSFQLLLDNPGVINAACSNLMPGEILCLGVVGQDCTDVHVVQPGDVCVNIANEAGILLSTLLANNPNVNSACSNLHVGEVLCTANEIFGF